MNMTCSITDGRPREVKRVIWRKGNKPITTSGLYTLSDKGKVMTISPLNSTLHNGYYSCAAENVAGMGTFSNKFHLEVNCKCAPILSEM